MTWLSARQPQRRLENAREQFNFNKLGATSFLRMKIGRFGRDRGVFLLHAPAATRRAFGTIRLAAINVSAGLYGAFQVDFNFIDSLANKPVNG